MWYGDKDEGPEELDRTRGGSIDSPRPESKRVIVCRKTRLEGKSHRLLWAELDAKDYLDKQRSERYLISINMVLIRFCPI